MKFYLSNNCDVLRKNGKQNSEIKEMYSPKKKSEKEEKWNEHLIAILTLRKHESINLLNKVWKKNTFT